jgi:hypothetical protein
MYLNGAVYKVQKNVLCGEHKAAATPSTPNLLSALKQLVGLTWNSAQLYMTESSVTSNSCLQIHR